MAITFNLAVGQEDTGGVVLVDDTLGALINLRSAANSYATAAYTGALVDHGVYTFTSVIPGIYKVYNNTTELTIFGQIQIGESDAVLKNTAGTIVSQQTFTAAPIFSNGIYTDTIAEKTASAGITFSHKATMNQLFLTSMGKAFSMGGFDISGLITPVGGSSAVCQSWADDNYFQKTGSTAQSIPNTIATTFRGRLYYSLSPTSPFEVSTVKYVKDYVNNYLTGSLTIGQQAETMIVVDYFGTQEDGRRYTNITAGMAACAAYADTTKQYQLFIEGNGDTDVTMDLDYNLLQLTDLADFIDIVGLSPGIIMKVEEGTYDCNAKGNNIFKDITIDNVGDVTTAFVDAIFHNVTFINSGGTGTPTYTLTNCELINCKREGVTVTRTGCIGTPLIDVTNNQSTIVTKLMDEGGAYEIAYANGDIRGKRILGRQGADVTSDSNIALGEGNYFHLTGTKTIDYMSVSNWTPGSRVTLFSESGLTITNSAGAGSAPHYPFVMRAGANKVLAAGAWVSFILGEASLYWIED